MVLTLIGHPVLDEAGEKVGTIDDVVYDARTLEPRWLSIKIGLLKGHRLVPVDLTDDDGATALVHTTKQTVSDAPRPDAPGPPSNSEERTLRDHYGLPPAVQEEPPPVPKPRRQPQARARRPAARQGRKTT